MKTIFLTFIVALAIAAPATAFEPTGLYIGVTGTLAPGEVTDQVKTSEGLAGGMFGGQIGYRFPAGMFVPGIEADYLWGETSAETANEHIGIDQIGTMRATLGVSLGPLLPYLSGGVALAQASVKDKTLLQQPVQDNAHFGLTAGAGLELAITGNLSVRGEYQFTSLGPMDYSLSGGQKSLQYDLHAFKLGANLRF